MQVEVTKFTEGRRDDIKRPNDLPVSLIRYDARQKEEAELGVQELVEAIQHKPENSTRELLKSEASTSSTMLTEKNPSKKAKSRTSGLMTLLGKPSKSEEARAPTPVYSKAETEDVGPGEEKQHRHGIDLATTLERIQKNFVITDPRLPDNPIIFASDDFLELTEYTREEILGRNCRFLQGKDTNTETVAKIKHAIDNHLDITVQLLNYTKTGRPFWNLFHLQAVRDSKGDLQYFIGVQLDASAYVEPDSKKIPDGTKQKGTVEVKETALDVDVGLRELPDPNAGKDDIWAEHAKLVSPKPHKFSDPNWSAILQVRNVEGRLTLKDFRPIKPLGCGDTGSVHLVELKGSGKLFAMKAMDKEAMIERNKVHRA
uniref:Putative LOV domain-containing protein n=1 Tax=Mesotaenium caldariorum TaxID=31321 RepID=A0A126WXQ6_9VIRI|nr:putative LOV domain-containing protein [Mesotaenium caldariorum]